MSADDYLRHCRQRFDALVAAAIDHAETPGADERALRAVQAAAHYAWFHHPGRFVDHRLEAICVEIGQRLPPAPADLAARIDHEFAPRAGDRSKRRVLHVLSQALVIGGHTKLVMAWIRNDRTSDHSVALCSQEWQPYREDLEPTVREFHGGFVRFPPERPIVDRAAALRASARHFDLVVLHIHPDDPTPVAALADESLPPVGLLDHADHCFWLGSAIADRSIHLREFAAELAQRRRQRERVAVLPIPTDFPLACESAISAASRRSHRHALGLSEQCMLSVGTGYKWAPNADVDFFGSVAEVLDRRLQAELHVLGLDADEFAAFPIPTRRHPRVRLHGVEPRQRLRQFQQAAQLALEPFPFGSMTAMLENTMHGCWPMLGPKPASPILACAGDQLESRVRRPDSTAKWTEGLIAQLAELPDPPGDLRAELIDHHQGSTWRATLAAIYAQLESTRHTTRDLESPEPDTDSDDTVLSAFCLGSFGDDRE